MSEVFFYHLTRSSLEQTVTDLCAKCLSRDWKVLIHGPNADQLTRLDQAMWGRNDDSFLPHGQAGSGHDAMQPVLLSDQPDNANQARVLMLVDGAPLDVAAIPKYERVCLVFDGNNGDQLQQARADWKALTAVGIAAQYWSQEGGGWAMKAESKASTN